LGTKAEPYLSEEDKRRLKGKERADETPSEAEGSSRPSIVKDNEEDEDEDLPVGDQEDDNDLATTIGTKMTTTLTETRTHGGGPALPEDNPMVPPPVLKGQLEQLRLQTYLTNNQQNPPSQGPPGGNNPGGGPGGGGGNPGGGGGNPGGGGGNPGGPPGGQNHPGQNPAQAVQASRHLAGSLEAFDGDRAKSLDFEKNFGIYRMLNYANPMIAVPMQRIALALTYIKGPKVNNWSHQYADYLADQVWNQGRLPTDEALWNDFVIAFRRQFRDTGDRERAWGKLQTLEMKGKDLDGYIAEFETLLSLAGRDRTHNENIDTFRDGLQGWLHRAVFNRRPIPVTLDEWQWTAREELQIKVLRDASLGEGRQKFGTSSRQGRWDSLQKGAQKPKKRDPDAMDIDAARTNQLSKAEKEKLMKEGKCFLCKEGGHRARNCPTNKGKSRRTEGNRKSEPSKARTAHIEEVKEEESAEEKSEPPPPSYGEDDVVALVRKMKAGERENLLERIATEDF
jgi:hypothetical protein